MIIEQFFYCTSIVLWTRGTLSEHINSLFEKYRVLEEVIFEIPQTEKEQKLADIVAQIESCVNDAKCISSVELNSVPTSPLISPQQSLEKRLSCTTLQLDQSDEKVPPMMTLLFDFSIFFRD